MLSIIRWRIAIYFYKIFQKTSTFYSMICTCMYLYQVSNVSFSEKCDKNNMKMQKQNLSELQEQRSSPHSQQISTKRYEIKVSQCNNFQH